MRNEFVGNKYIKWFTIEYIPVNIFVFFFCICFLLVCCCILMINIIHWNNFISVHTRKNKHLFEFEMKEKPEIFSTETKIILTEKKE